MAQRTFEDPVLELAMRLGDGPEDVIELGADLTNAEAEIALEVLDEVDAEFAASDIVSRLRQQGHTL